MARFAATMNAIEKGLENVAPGTGAKAVEDWIEQLNGADFRGAKGLARDLDRLKKELEREEPREETVRKTFAKLGEATTKAAETAEGGSQQKLRDLGKALTEQAGGHTADAEEEDDA